MGKVTVCGAKQVIDLRIKSFHIRLPTGEALNVGAVVKNPRKVHQILNRQNIQNT